jgi:PadR family transcriptional regulator, regulatory protein PadR
LSRETLGEFEQLVLLACLRLGARAYTVPVLDELQARAARRVSHASVYVALTRLEKKGLVRSELGAPTPERGGRPKRFFTVQPEAIALLRDARDSLAAMWQGLEPLGDGSS